MGQPRNLTKEQQIDAQDLGFYTGWAKFVCERCVNDEALQEFIRDEATEVSCDFCGYTSPNEEPIAADVDEVIGLIHESASYFYGNPDEEMAWDSDEKDYFGDTYDKREMLCELGFESSNEKFRQFVEDSFVNELWCDESPYSLSQGQIFSFSWETFCNAVKHHTRYLFFPVNKRNDLDSEEIPPERMLDALRYLIKELGLIRMVPEGTAFIRGRVHESNVVVQNARELGSPPPEITRCSNRMSPAGISMFYGSLDEDTVISEIVQGEVSEESRVTVGTFRTLRSYWFLDLTNLPPIPSPFDRGKRHQIYSISFLHSFVADLTKPVKKDGREHIEYVPSQIATEYIRHRVQAPNGAPIIGVLYPSAVKSGGTSAVIFADNNSCCDSTTDSTEARKILALQAGSVRTRTLAVQ